MPCGAPFERYAVLRRAAGIGERSIKTEADSHRWFWRFLEGRGFAGDELAVGKDDFQAYAQHVLQRQDLQANSKLTLIGTLRPFYKEAVRQEWILLNPMDDIQNPRKIRLPPRVLTVPQVKQLLEQPDLATAIGLRDRAILELFYSCALRRDELLSLRKENFSEGYRRLRFRGKGNKDAVLPVGKAAAHFTAFYTERLRPLLNRHGYPQLFLSALRFAPLSRETLTANLGAYGRKAEIKLPVTPHVFRYSIATHLAEENVDIRLIQAFLRHDDLDTTARYIRHSFQKLQDVHRATHPRETGRSAD